MLLEPIISSMMPCSLPQNTRQENRVGDTALGKRELKSQKRQKSATSFSLILIRSTRTEKSIKYCPNLKKNFQHLSQQKNDRRLRYRGNSHFQLLFSNSSLLSHPRAAVLYIRKTFTALNHREAIRTTRPIKIII